ncbi:MAG TPA: ribonucleoside-diphosphate reductase subunit alpha [Alphaproteobacteria bacterium]
MLHVTKRDGSAQEFAPDKINRRAQLACKGIGTICGPLTDVSASDIILKAQMDIYEGISTRELDLALINSARGRIQFEPNYSLAAARLVLFMLYEEVMGPSEPEEWFAGYRDAFKTNIKRMVDEELLNPELATFDLDKLAAAFDFSRDYHIQYLGIQTLYDRYFIQDKKKNRLELPQAFFMRVAMGLSLNEENREEKAIEFYNKLSSFDMISATPTLFNSGTPRSQLSSCFLNTFDDSIDGIFDGLWQEARKSKYAGGLGFDMTPLRSRNSYIKGTNGENQGTVYFWKLYNDLLIAVNQGGKRKGNGCAYLETWHGDIEDFLNLRKNTGDERIRTHDMNTANWIPDLFMKQVLNDGPWYLFSPNEAPELHVTYGAEFEKHYWNYVEKGKRGELRVFEERVAKDMWKKMLRALFETGHPWITFKDPSNIRYAMQHEGVVRSSNLCTEILLHTIPSEYEEGVKTKIGETAVCNLSQINLAAHVKDAEVQWDKLAGTIKSAMRMLDNVIELNYYPTQEARNATMKHRYVGMGTMGWQDVFYMMGVNYESVEAAALADQIMEFISYHAILASSELAKERGKFSTYEGSTWSQNIFPIDTYKTLMEERGEHGIMIGEAKETLDWAPVRDHVKQYGMRNALTMAIAPTATTSFIVGASQSIEPDFSVLYVYSTMSGEFTMVNQHFVADMKRLGLWDEDMVTIIKHVDGDLSLLDDEVMPPQIKAKYKIAFNIDQKKLLECGAARQKWIDQGISLNLYNNKTSLKELNDLYFHAWQVGLKTTYYLRNEAASKIEKATVDTSQIEQILETKKQQLADQLTPVAGSAGLNRIDTNGIECIGCQ